MITILWKLKPKTKSAHRHGPKYSTDLNTTVETMSYEKSPKYVESSNNLTEQNENYPAHSLIIETPR